MDAWLPLISGRREVLGGLPVKSMAGRGKSRLDPAERQELDRPAGHQLFITVPAVLTSRLYPPVLQARVWGRFESQTVNSNAQTESSEA